MFIQEILSLTERRRNPLQNLKIAGHEEALIYLQKHWKNSALEEYGVSMTTVPKLGVNPGSKFNTPLGIYFYPASYYIEKKRKKVELDYQDDAPFIQIFKFKSDKVVEVDTMHQQELNQYIKALYSNISRIASLLGVSEKITETMLSRAIIDSRHEAKVQEYGGQLWYILWALSNSHKQHDKMSKAGIMAKRGPIVWNSIFRLIDIDILIDNGAKIIHENEPCQGVVINPRSIQLVKSIENINPKSRTSPINKLLSVKSDVKLKPGQKLFKAEIEYYDKNQQKNVETGTIVADNKDEAIDYMIKILDIEGKDILEIRTKVVK